MTNIKPCNLILLLLFASLLAAPYVVQGSTTQGILPHHHQSFSHNSPVHSKLGSSEAKMNMSSRRLMIESTAPTCTYNEFRGCKYKCRAE